MTVLHIFCLVGSSCPVSVKAYIGYKVLSHHVSVWSLIPHQLRSIVDEVNNAHQLARDRPNYNPVNEQSAPDAKCLRSNVPCAVVWLFDLQSVPARLEVNTVHARVFHSRQCCVVFVGSSRQQKSHARVKSQHSLDLVAEHW